MASIKPYVTITVEQWHAKQARGLTAVIAHHPYIVLTHGSTREPVYQPVAILEPERRR